MQFSKNNMETPPYEQKRLQALRRYGILDTPTEPAFDRITVLVAKLIQVPIAHVTFIDKARQWFKSSQGSQTSETSREYSFCSHAILNDEIMVVADATRDKRFQDNPFVKGNPHIRSYAGIPLQSSDGFNLGTLCAIDTKPREFTAEEIEILRDLAAIVIDELEFRLATRERSQLMTAIHQLNSGVLITDPNLPDNPIIFANPGFLRITGYSLEEIEGVNCRFLQGPETGRGIVDKIRNALSERRTFHEEVLNYRKDGTPFWNELKISPVFDGAGELISFIGLQYDVTERKHMADQLQQSFEKLKELEELRDSLIGMIIHDLRSPLASIMAVLDMLKSFAVMELNDEAKELIELASLSSATLNEMITSLLDVSRLETGKMPLNISRVDLRKIIMTVTDTFVPLIGTRSLLCDLPDCPVEVSCDDDMMRRVITNIVNNAIKFTPEGGKIRVSIAQENNKVKVSITDTGVGIPAEYHARIFEKFGQVKGGDHRHSTGLGLTFCKLAIEAHGGVIGVESVEGKGTTIWFALSLEHHS